MKKQSHKDHLYDLAKFYNKLDNNMIKFIEDYLNSLPEDIELSDDIEDSKPKNAYRYAFNSVYGKSKTFWKKIKNYINNEKE